MRRLSLFAAVLVAGSLVACKEKKTSTTLSLDKCVRLAACFSETEPVSTGETCTIAAAFHEGLSGDRSSETKLTRALVDCAIAASDCAGVRACFVADSTEAAACTPGSGTDVCVGDVLVECTSNASEVPDAFDCGSAGLHCGATTAGAGCGESACTPGTDTDRCDGTLLMRCNRNSGMWTARDCAFSESVSCGPGGCETYAGGTCGLDQQGTGRCIGTGPSCDASSLESHCEGSVLVSCREGQEARLDCRTLHPTLNCVQPPGDPPSCDLSTSCELEDETCQDGRITFCHINTVTEVDCLALGYSGCAVDTVSGGGNDAYCVP